MESLILRTSGAAIPLSSSSIARMTLRLRQTYRPSRAGRSAPSGRRQLGEHDRARFVDREGLRPAYSARLPMRDRAWRGRSCHISTKGIIPASTFRQKPWRTVGGFNQEDGEQKARLPGSFFDWAKVRFRLGLSLCSSSRPILPPRR